MLRTDLAVELLDADDHPLLPGNHAVGRAWRRLGQAAYAPDERRVDWTVFGLLVVADIGSVIGTLGGVLGFHEDRRRSKSAMPGRG